MQVKFTAMGASQTQLNTVISAAATLYASISASSTSSEIITAFDNYHTTVVNELRVTLGLDATTTTTIESNIAVFKSELKSSVFASASTDVIVNAYMKFYSDVKAGVEAILTSSSQTEVNAAAQIFILLNAQF